MLIIGTYLIYILVSICFTIWVGKNLHKNGRIFLIDAFEKSSEKADAVNQLLLVGFYLVNFGIVFLFLSYGGRAINDITVAIEHLAFKFGVVLVVLGAMHFFNMKNIAKMRAKALRKQYPQQTI